MSKGRVGRSELRDYRKLQPPLHWRVRWKKGARTWRHGSLPGKL